MGFFFRFYTISYERKLTAKTSAQLSVGIMDDMLDDNRNNLFSSNYNNSDFKAFYIIPEYRFYPSKGFGKGFYISPYARLNFITLRQNNFSENYFQFNPGFLAGWQWVFGNEFSLDLGSGLELVTHQNLILKDKFGSELISEKYPAVMPRISFSIGYKF